MCIIAVKSCKAEWPSEEAIINCCDANRDGFAFAWNEGNKTKTFRTMSQKKALNFYRTFVTEHDCKQTSMIFHARWATHGTKTQKNTHCWKANNIAFAHNGIMHIYDNDLDKTDSEYFFRNVFMPMARKNLDVALKTADVIATQTHSRFAFIKGAYTVILGNNWYKDKQTGVLYSNLGFQGHRRIF